MAQSFSQCNLGVDKLQVKAFGHCLAGHFAFVDIEAGEKPASYLAMRVQSLKTLVRQSKAIGQGSVIQRSEEVCGTAPGMLVTAKWMMPSTT